jgi:hypothetical protein
MWWPSLINTKPNLKNDRGRRVSAFILEKNQGDKSNDE